MLGWRKLSAWGLIFALCAAVALKAIAAGSGDIPPGVADLLQNVTWFFFGSNLVEHIAGKVQVVSNTGPNK